MECLGDGSGGAQPTSAERNMAELRLLCHAQTRDAIQRRVLNQAQHLLCLRGAQPDSPDSTCDSPSPSQLPSVLFADAPSITPEPLTHRGEALEKFPGAPQLPQHSTAPSSTSDGDNSSGSSSSRDSDGTGGGCRPVYDPEPPHWLSDPEFQDASREEWKAAEERWLAWDDRRVYDPEPPHWMIDPEFQDASREERKAAEERWLAWHDRRKARAAGAAAAQVVAEPGL